MKELTKNNNARRIHSGLRNKHRARLRAMGCECGICGGRLGAIHYDEPSDAKHPLSFVVDEIKPISRWKEFGYESPVQAADDWDNLQAAHYVCNQLKSNKTNFNLSHPVITTGTREKRLNISDGLW